jgi:hypothetical protein
MPAAQQGKPNRPANKLARAALTAKENSIPAPAADTSRGDLIYGQASAINTHRKMDLSKMDDLTMDLVRLCRRNRDGSYGTQTNRKRGLAAMAAELADLGYQLPNTASLKPKHAEALVEKWLNEDKTDATIRNRLTFLRWWAEKVGKSNVIHRDNRTYGVGERGEAMRNRAQTLDMTKFRAIECPYIRASVLLQVAFGLRREEALNSSRWLPSVPTTSRSRAAGPRAAGPAPCRSRRWSSVRCWSTRSRSSKARTR